MNHKFSDIQPYLTFDNTSHPDYDFIITKKGDISVVLKMELPEIYTLSSEDFELLNKSFQDMLGQFSPNTVVHKQDYFFEDVYKGVDGNSDSYLYKAQEKHFLERGFLYHESYLIVTRCASKSNTRNVFSSLFTRKGKALVKQSILSEKALIEFISEIERSVNILMSTKFFDITTIDHLEIRTLAEQYFSMSKGGGTVSDFVFDEEMNIGAKKAKIYSISHNQDLPEVLFSSSTIPEFCTDQTEMHGSFIRPLCFELNCDHVLNQIFFIDNRDEMIKGIQSATKSLGGVAKNSAHNSEIYLDNSAYITDYYENNLKPIKTHMNLIVVAKDANHMRQLDSDVTTAFQKLDIKPYANFVSFGNLLWGSAPGNGGDIPSENKVISFMENVVTLINYETNYKSGVNGLVFFDRLSQRPVMVDTWDAPKKKGLIANRNAIALGGSGEGKSVLFNHIFSQYLEQNYKLVILDIGNSYKKLCELYGGKYFAYSENEPIPFNPFLIEGKSPNTEELEFLCALIEIIWKNNGKLTKEEDAILKESLIRYYVFMEKNKNLKLGFPSFYSYFKEKEAAVINEKYHKDLFYVDSFLVVLNNYGAGGKYEHLFNSEESLDLKNDNLVIFELDNIKDHPILFPIVALIIVNVITKTVWKAKGVKKAIWMDEAWKVLEKDGMDSFIKYLYKTIRKFDGQAGLIVQNITDIPDGPIGEAILGNCDIKVLLPQRKTVEKFPLLKTRLSLTNRQMSIMGSAISDFSSGYSEFTLILGKLALVYRLELTKQAFAVFNSDEDENIEIYKAIEEYGDIKLAIDQHIEDIEEIE